MAPIDATRAATRRCQVSADFLFNSVSYLFPKTCERTSCRDQACHRATFAATIKATVETTVEATTESAVQSAVEATVGATAGVTVRVTVEASAETTVEERNRTNLTYQLVVVLGAIFFFGRGNCD